MKILKWAAIVIGILLVVILALLAFHGFFGKLNVSTQKMGPFTFVYERFTGPYMQTGKVFYRVHKSLEADGITATRGLGIYYDDPKKTSSDKLRSDCGSLIEPKDQAKIYRLKKYKIKHIISQHFAVAEFPIKSHLSYMIAPMKGYSALLKYVKETGLKISKGAVPMELYDVPAKKIYFLLGIVK
ncbi:MAG: GyrI-like domain-containing protein [Spirochaetes bacterium]|nr:GyrI-like domain-containing protein [Spirochaetota bacterium]